MTSLSPGDAVEFDEARWRRVAASDDDVERLRYAFSAMTIDERRAERDRIASLSDGDLAAELGSTPGPVEAAEEAAEVVDVPVNVTIPDDSGD